MLVNVSRKDVFWGYFAQFFSIGSGIITLPLVLHMLSEEEIGMNYLMLTLGSLVALFDFGFSPQFGRNVTYIFSGAQELKEEGISVSSSEINYRLLATMIHTAKSVYYRLGMIVFLSMLTFGSVYVYKVTDGFTNIKHSFFIWIIYSISTFFNIYYSYYTSLLTGKGLIMESKKAMVYSKVVYILLTFTFLYLGLGLFGVVLANLIAPFVNRYMSYYYFFTNELKEKISIFNISSKEKKDLFLIIWHNAKKLGWVFIGGYAISKLSMFLAGLYLSLSEIASYGLMMQLVGIIMVISSTLFTVYEPKFASLRVEKKQNKLLNDFAFSMTIYYCLFIIGSLFLIFIVPQLLIFIDSNATLPPIEVLCLYSIIMLLEGNHSNFATFIVTKNNIPFVESSLIAGFCIALGSYLLLAYTSLAIWGLVLVQGLCQIAYANWKWPYIVCKELGVNFYQFVRIGIRELTQKIKSLSLC